MIDYIDNYYNKNVNEHYEMESASKKAFSDVLPLIMNNELSQKQNICLQYYYVFNKNQAQIARMLNLSQPTVSRHIAAAKEIVNNKLKYCHVALTSGLNEYERLMEEVF